MSVNPLASDGFVRFKVIDESVAAVTVKVAVAILVPAVAVMTVLPSPTPVARPFTSMVATPVIDELNVALAVRSWVDISE